MQKIARSQAKFFIYADGIYDAVRSLYNTAAKSVFQQPKTWFRVLAMFVAMAVVYSIAIGIFNAVASDLSEREFKARHAALFESIRNSISDPTYRMPYTMEQRAVAFKMFTCHPHLGNGELNCAGSLIADAAVSGGEQRANTIKNTLLELHFNVPGGL